MASTLNRYYACWIQAPPQAPTPLSITPSNKVMGSGQARPRSQVHVLLPAHGNEARPWVKEDNHTHAHNYRSHATSVILY